MKQFFLNILAIILLLEEWLWEGLSGLAHGLISLLRLQAVELWLTQTRPPVALAAMLAPLVIVGPLNFFAIWMLWQGHVLAFAGLELAAKLLGTLLVARVFCLTKPQLLTYRLINAVYVAVSGWLAWAHKKIVATTIYRLAHEFKAAAKARWRRWRG